jgi:hypothetical protein
VEFLPIRGDAAVAVPVFAPYTVLPVTVDDNAEVMVMSAAKAADDMNNDIAAIMDIFLNILYAPFFA